MTTPIGTGTGTGTGRRRFHLPPWVLLVVAALVMITMVWGTVYSFTDHFAIRGMENDTSTAVRGIKTVMDTLGMSADGSPNRLDKIEKRLDGHDTTLKTHDDKLKDQEQKIADQSTLLDKIKALLGMSDDPQKTDKLTQLDKDLQKVSQVANAAANKPTGLSASEVDKIVNEAVAKAVKDPTGAIKDAVAQLRAEMQNEMATKDAKARTDFLNLLDTKLTELEKKTGTNADITNLKDEIKTQRDEINTLKTDINSVKTDVKSVNDKVNNLSKQSDSLPPCNFETKPGKISGTTWSYWETGVGLVKSCRATVGANELMIVGGTNVKIGGSNQGSVNSGQYLVLTAGTYDLELYSGFAGKRDKTISLQAEYNARIDEARSKNQPVGVQVTNTSTTGVVAR